MKDVKAPFGEKTIELKLRFGTTEISPIPGHVVPKHCRSWGWVSVMANKSHGIKSDKKPIVFHSMAEIPAIIEKALIMYGITLHPSRIERKIRGGTTIRYKK